MKPYEPKEITSNFIANALDVLHDNEDIVIDDSGDISKAICLLEIALEFIDKANWTDTVKI
jgi:hypothetical protein